MKNSSCGSCVSQGMNKIQEFLNKNTNEDGTLKNDTIDVDSLKYSCEIVVNDPNDFHVVDPLNCKYFFSNSFKFRL